MSARGDRLATTFVRSGRPDPLGLRADAPTRIMKPGSTRQVPTMSDRHLTADLNVRDDDGFGWTTLNETNGLGRVRTEIMLLTGSSRTMAVVRVTAADDDGWVHFSTSPGQWRRTASCLGASLRKPQPKAAAVAKPRTEPGKRLWIGAAMGDRRAPNPKVAGPNLAPPPTRRPGTLRDPRRSTFPAAEGAYRVVRSLGYGARVGRHQ